MQELNDKISQLEAENTSAKQENSTLQYRIGECQMEIRKLTEELKLAQRSADDARRDVKVVQSQLTEANDTISILRADVQVKTMLGLFFCLLFNSFE
jgi:predicted  nucleic acid-binding Zn-ribbon protein